MSRTKQYSIGELAKAAGVSTRTLRHYEDCGVLVPHRLPNGYRAYDERDAKLLAHIIAMRACGLPLAVIKELLSDAEPLVDVLNAHLQTLRAQEDELRQTIANTEAAIVRIERIETMKTDQAFEELKRQGIREFEETYGQEARERYGSDVIDAANARMADMTQEEWNDKEQLERAILTMLSAALQTGDAAGPQAREVVQAHRRWVGIHWGRTPEDAAYRSLAQGYLADQRFVDYYDGPCGAGATAFLVAAIEASLEQ